MIGPAAAGSVPTPADISNPRRTSENLLWYSMIAGLTSDQLFVYVFFLWVLWRRLPTFLYLRSTKPTVSHSLPPAALRWKCSASRSPTRCRHLTTSAASSATVHSRCMHCECCGTMASAKLVFRQFSGRSLCLGWHTQRERGLDLSLAQTTSASKHSFTGASDVDTARQICQTLFSWWRNRTSGYLEESTTIQATFCADCSRPIDGDTAVQSAASSTWQTNARSHRTLGR